MTDRECVCINAQIDKGCCVDELKCCVSRVLQTGKVGDRRWS